MELAVCFIIAGVGLLLAIKINKPIWAFFIGALVANLTIMLAGGDNIRVLTCQNKNAEHQMFIFVLTDELINRISPTLIQEGLHCEQQDGGEE